MEATAISVSERTMMWGRVGTIFADKPATAEEAVVKGGLGWNVELRALGVQSADGDDFVEAPGLFGTVRTDTEAVLGMVRSRYHVIQNRECFNFADNLVDGAGASFESAWSMNGGKTIGLTMKLPSTITVGGEDNFDSYLMLRSSHDGSSALKVGISTLRMACLNQFNVNLATAKRTWSVHHTGNVKARVAQAREALELAWAYDEAFEISMERLLSTPLSDKRAEQVLTTTLRQQRLSEDTTAQIAAAILGNRAYSATIADDTRQTAYGLLNSSTEYFDHLRTYRTPEAAVKVTTEGLGARVNQALVGAFN